MSNTWKEQVNLYTPASMSRYVKGEIDLPFSGNATNWHLAMGDLAEF